MSTNDKNTSHYLPGPEPRNRKLYEMVKRPFGWVGRTVYELSAPWRFVFKYALIVALVVCVVNYFTHPAGTSLLMLAGAWLVLTAQWTFYAGCVVAVFHVLAALLRL